MMDRMCSAQGMLTRQRIMDGPLRSLLFCPGNNNRWMHTAMATDVLHRCGRRGNETRVTAIDIDYLKEWLSRMETTTGQLSVSRVDKLAATLNRADRPNAGQPLLQLWHGIYFMPHATQSEFGADSHPRRAGLPPPVPRRMWAEDPSSYLAMSAKVISGAGHAH